MTREEAIEYGQFWLDMNEDSKNSNTYKFFQMAIKALEQESVLDKVRAEIEQITDTIHHGVSFYRYVSAIDVLQIIDKYKAESEDL